jgi:hypothetical protein
MEFESVKDFFENLPKVGMAIDVARQAMGMKYIEERELPREDPTPAKKKKEDPAPKAEEAKTEEAAPQDPEPTKAPAKDAPKDTDVRKALSLLMKSGRKDDVKEILGSFGASNFSGLKPEDFQAVIDKANAILKEGDKDA